MLAMIQAYSQSERSPVNLLGADAFEIEHTAFPRKHHVETPIGATAASLPFK
uniref:AlNc14C193G8514 protein n=1 Tax=Albugo laibachii Nc14 TaxID=890382 RepID=F0WQ33_9STRA|nr:AlNc14C193G8514 [Albugo laibachii Nc14]|eukprot:CCA23438.1 AlNc14C193G8514 [Albugo laibachii Nc14]